MSYAPIVLFTYNRPWHTKRTVEALQKNDLAQQSDLIVYSDAPKNSKAVANVNQVREYLYSIKGFRKINIIEREKNWGLAKSIIDGVTEVINRYGKIIVLEDDIVTSPAFLDFMNGALDHYEDCEKVWHISGWNYPIENISNDDYFFWKVMNCWGWATWDNKWRYFNKDTDYLIITFTKPMIREFDLDNSGIFWSQVLDNKNNKIDTWAIFWYATIFLHDGLCLNPSISYVENIGHDGSGENCSVNDRYCQSMLNTDKNIIFNLKVSENTNVTKKVVAYNNSLKPSILKQGMKIIDKYKSRFRLD